MFRRLLCLFALLSASLLAPPAMAQEDETPLLIDRSSDRVKITTGFIGSDVVVFGALDGAGDVIVIVEGPPTEATVRQRGQLGPIWANVDSMDLSSVPSFYFLSSNRPITDFASTDLLEQWEIGLKHLTFTPEGGEDVSPERLELFREALIRNKQSEDLYVSHQGDVTFTGDRLFKTTVFFPDNVPLGTYSLTVHLIRDGAVAATRSMDFSISKTGFSAQIFDFSRQQSALYGILAILGAVFAGWAAGEIFRKK